MKYFIRFIIIILTIILIGCANSGRLVSLETKNNECIVVGRLNVLYNDIDVTTKTTILFNEMMWGKYPYKADNTGLIITKLPLGQNYISRIVYRNFHINVGKGYATFKITDSSKIYYIGDITIQWNGDKYKLLPGGALFSLIDQASSDGGMKLTVEDNYAECINDFKKYYNSTNHVIKSLININPTKLNESLKTEDDYSFKVVLDNNKEIKGEIRRINNKEIYLTKYQLLYIIKRKRIFKIYENNIEISQSDLLNRKYGRIIYGKYPETKYID
jgi:hypothetical protein